MAKLLEVAQLVDDHGMAEVQIGRGGVEPQLDAQLPPGGEFLFELCLDDQLVRAPTDGLDGLLNGGHIRLPRVIALARLRRLLNKKGF